MGTEIKTTKKMSSVKNRTPFSWLPVRFLTTRPLNQPRRSVELQAPFKWLALAKENHTFSADQLERSSAILTAILTEETINLKQ